MNELVFTRPEMLWGLPAAALPLIIHLINRHRARRRPFAAMDFLLRVKRLSARRILLRHILLLLVRTLLIACLVLAAAGPFISALEAGARRGPVHTALVVDLSLSMRGNDGEISFFGAAVEKARRFLLSMAPEDKACLVAAGLTCRALVEPCSDSRSTLLDALDRLEPQWGESNLIAAIETGAALLADTGEGEEIERRILLLTDASAHAFTGTPQLAGDSPTPRVVLENVAPDIPRDNAAVGEVRLRAKARYLEVSAGLRSYSRGDEPGLSTEVAVGKQVLSRGFVDLPAGETARKVFHIQAPAEAELLTVRLPRSDTLSADNERRAHVAGRRLVRALLVNGDMRPVLHRDELFYLENALSPAGEVSSGIRFTTVTPDRLQGAMLDDVEVVFLANIHDYSPAVISKLRGFVSGGGGLFVSLGDNVNVDLTNRVLDDLLPWKLRDVIATGPADPDGAHRRGTTFTRLDRAHPLFVPFSKQVLDAIERVRTWKAAVLEPGAAGPRTRVLMDFANGSPALVEKPYGNGKVILFTSTLDRDWSAWPARASYLPFLQRATIYLAGRLERLPPPEATVGAPVDIPLADGADGVTVNAPDGRQFELVPEGSDVGVVTFADTSQPGWYAVAQTAAGRGLSKETVPGILVHLPRRESDLSPVDAEVLGETVGKAASFSVAGVDGDAAGSRTALFLLLALGLLLMEAFLTRK